MSRSPAERMRDMRQRKRAEKQVASQTEGALEPAEVKMAAASIIEATRKAEAAEPRLVTIGNACVCGYYVRVFVEVTGGSEDAAYELRNWLAQNPPDLWVFKHYLSVLSLWGSFEAWRSSFASPVSSP